MNTSVNDYDEAVLQFNSSSIKSMVSKLSVASDKGFMDVNKKLCRVALRDEVKLLKEEISQLRSDVAEIDAVSEETLRGLFKDVTDHQSRRIPDLVNKVWHEKNKIIKQLHTKDNVARFGIVALSIMFSLYFYMYSRYDFGGRFAY